MTRNKIAILLAAAGIAITAGTAFTESLGGVPASTTLGQQSTTVVGGTATSILYTYNAPKTEVATITVTFSGNTHGHELWAVPNVDAVAPAAPGAAADCGDGVHTTDTEYVCTVSGSDWNIHGLTSIGFTLTA
jgi:hypothetical protein